MRCSPLSAPAALLVLSACAASTPDNPEGERMEVEAVVGWVPALSIVADVDEAEPGGGIVFGADVEDGDGWYAHADVGPADGAIGIGATFVRTRHQERRTGAGLDLHMAQGDVAFRTRVGNDTIAFRPTFGVAGGLAVLDFDSVYDDWISLCGALVGGVSLELLGHVVLDARVEAFLLGYPSETVATGAFVSVGGGVRF